MNVLLRGNYGKEKRADKKEVAEYRQIGPLQGLRVRGKSAVIRQGVTDSKR